MGIEFGVLAATDIDAACIGSIRVGGDAYAVDLSAGGAVASGFVRISGAGHASQSGGGAPAIIIPSQSTGTLRAVGSILAGVDIDCECAGAIGFAGSAFGSLLGDSTIDVMCAGTLPLAGFALEDVANAASAILIEQPAVVAGFGDMWGVRVVEVLRTRSAYSPMPIQVTRERALLNGAPLHRFDGGVRATDQLAVGELVSWVAFAAIEDLFVLGDIASAHHTALGRALERILLSGRADSVADALVALLDGLVLRSLADAFQVGAAADTLLTQSHIDSLYSAFARVLERLLVAGAASPSYTATAIVSERVLLGADLSHQADAVAVIRDSVGFAISLSLDSGEYIAWVLNTESKGLSRYTNYPFNSFAEVGGRWFGASSDGLYWLDGDTDDGEDIHARIRLGMNALGTRRLKRIPEAFIGYTSSGTLLLQVIQTNDETGLREAVYCRLPVRPATSKREGRFKPGRGLKAVDFDFVIENVDGADFDLSNIEFHPLNLERRTRG